MSPRDPSSDIRMINVGGKPITVRTARASGRLIATAETVEQIRSGALAKGDPLATARVAGIMAAKKTADLVPLCHPLALTHVNIELTIELTGPAVYCRTTVETHGQTGVEMEALTAVSVAALTIYDMCKSHDREMVISDICLLEKRGGKSGIYQRDRER